MSREWLLKFIQHRVADTRILRLIQKWLSAGVMDEGERKDTGLGTPQGLVISPLLANIYLWHYVFDLWVEARRQKCAQGEVMVVRSADDNVFRFQYAVLMLNRFLVDFQNRLRKFGLKLNLRYKTRRIEVRRFAELSRLRRGEGKLWKTSDFLGIHAHQREEQKRVSMQVKRKTIGKKGGR